MQTKTRRKKSTSKTRKRTKSRLGEVELNADGSAMPSRAALIRAEARAGETGLEKFKGYTLYAGIGLAVLGGGYFAFNRLVVAPAKEQSKQTELIKSATTGSPANFAAKLESAMFHEHMYWLSNGTDEEVVYSTFRQMMATSNPKKTYLDTIDSYKKQFNRNLIEDLKEELDTREQATAFAILNNKI